MAKKEMAVTIETGELRYAIRNKTHITARSLEASGKLNYEAASHLQASDVTEDSYELARAMSDAISSVKVALGEYLDEEATASDTLVKEAVEKGEPVVLNFLMPGNWNGASADALGAGIHDYVVGRGVYEWYRETCPELAEACKADALDALAIAKSALWKRSRPARPACRHEI